METKQTPKLSLRKEVITQLNDDQLKTFVGGLAEEPSTETSCHDTSCNSQVGAGSCSGPSGEGG